MRGELSGDEALELHAALKSIQPALPEELLKIIMGREVRVSLGPDLDFLDYNEICSLPGARFWCEFDISCGEDPDAASQRAVNNMRTQGIELARAGGVIISLLSRGGKHSQLSELANSIRAHLHRASLHSLGCFDGQSSQECISCLIIVTGINMLESFVFIGPEEEFSRRFERLTGIPPISEIPAFLRQIQGTN